MKWPLRQTRVRPETPRQRKRPVSDASQSGQSAQPVFSYYASSRERVAVPDRQAPSLNQSRNRTAADVQRLQPTPGSGLQRFGRVLAWSAVVLIGLRLMWLSTSAPTVVVRPAVSDRTVAHSVPASDRYDAAVRRALQSTVLNHTKLTYNAASLEQTLLKEFPELRAVNMRVSLTSTTPHIELYLAQTPLVLESRGNTYTVSDTGYILGEVRSGAIGERQIRVVDQSAAEVRVGKQFLPSRTIDFIRIMHSQLTGQDMQVNTYVLPARSPYELQVTLAARPYIVRCNLTEDALQQSGAAVAVVRSGAQPREYIDVRVPGRAYYK